MVLVAVGGDGDGDGGVGVGCCRHHHYFDEEMTNYRIESNSHPGFVHSIERSLSLNCWNF